MSLHTLKLVCFLAIALTASALQCGRDVGGKLCAGRLCCSQYGYCGNTSAYCGTNCQSQCGGGGSTPTPTPSTPTPSTPSPVGSGIGGLISEATFNQMLLHRNDNACPASNFYTYDTFVAVANSFSGFATTGDTNTRKKEIAAFLGQTSHETTGGWASAPDGPYSWGYCFKKEIGSPPDYCVQSSTWPCAAGKKYYGRGPIQISYNYNYGPAGRAIGSDLLNNPDLVENNATIAFQAALWFWMTTQLPKPSSHDVITGMWTPSAADTSAGRLPGYGVITNIVNGRIECGHGRDARVQDRIGFYQTYCQIMGVSPGDNLDCANQRPFGS